ncbi:DNA-binding transcriptional regulator GbsR (MarR family) [Oceanobacillus polygoni]|uniref:HTH-type transcriptional regulator n=2 Tax=Oceanobacillus polygoni TaxID=1235259 RepID=A0A9X1CG25_9BACI|nr:DNA-binding transcriptional regulator GbsR (MarR family) [Oceanobacillus polygoni]
MEEKASLKMMQIEDKFIENIADNMRMYGISTTVGRVLGIIYINRNPMTLDELSEATGMSKTRMSQVVREMVDHNIAEKVFEKGVRKDIYNVEQDYYQTFISLFTSGWQRVIKRNRLVGKKLSAELANLLENETINEETEAKINDLLNETKEWLNYYDWLNRLVEFFDSGEVFNYVPKEK